MTITISAIAWNDSNLFGFTILFRNFLRSNSSQVCLNLYLGPKVSQEARFELNSSSFGLIYPIHEFKLYELRSKIELIFFSITGTAFNGFFKRIFSRHNVSAAAYFMPSPSNPPLLLLLPRDVYFYGDGFGSTPSLNYQWQPSLFRLPLLSFLRYAVLFLDRLALGRTKNISTKTFYDCLQHSVIKSEMARIVEFLYLRNSAVASYLQSCPFGSSNIIIVLSMLSPSRCSFQSELDLYIDQLQNTFSENLATLANSSIFFKFHFHHSKDFKDRFLTHISASLGRQVYCLELDIPIEAIGCLLPRSFPSQSFTFFCYQESIRLLSLLADHGGYDSEKLEIKFGFDDFLLKRYLPQTEAVKKIEYQNTLRSTIYDS